MNLRKCIQRSPVGRLLNRLLVGLLLVSMIDMNQQTVFGMPTAWVHALHAERVGFPMLAGNIGPTSNSGGSGPRTVPWLQASLGGPWGRGFVYQPHLGSYSPLSRAVGGIGSTGLAAPKGVGDLAQAAPPSGATPAEAACVALEARAKSGKVQLVWNPVPGTFTYEIYRGFEADPVVFQRIGDVAGNSTTYLDGLVPNEMTHLYFVRAVGPGVACDSLVSSAHPTASRRPANYPPVIYSAPPGTANPAEVLRFRVRASDPNPGDVLLHELVSGPAGMRVLSGSGEVEWLTEPGEHEITLGVTDGKGGFDFQTFLLRIPEARVAVPDVVGLSQADAETELFNTSLVMGAVTTANDPNVPAGTILSQNPVGGTLVPPGSAVALVVSAGPSDVIVPNVVGETEGVGSAALVAAGLSVGPVTTANDPNVPAGTILSQNPVGGTSVPPGSAVALVVSAGPADVIVPNVVGETEGVGSAALVAAGLSVGPVTTANDPNVPAGTILSQNPVGGTSVPPGSAVALVVSAGPADVIVPNVVGETEGVGSAALVAAGLTVGAVTTANDPNVPAGTILSQNPVGGTSVPPGSAVALVVSAGPADVIVPNVVGETEGVGSAALVAAGLTVGAVTTANDPNVPAGTILSQNPVGGTSVPPGSAVALVVSAGPSDVIVPNVVGETEGVGSAALVAAGLSVGAVTTANDPNVPAGTILSQNPVGGTSVPPGSAVALVVSAGPSDVIVPNVVGETEGVGSAALVAAGLTVGAVTTANDPNVPAGTILSQNPVGGTSVPPGSAVALVVSAGPADVIVPNVVGETEGVGSAALVAAGLTVGAVTTANDPNVPAGTILSQNPVGGTSVPPGSAVALVVSAGPADVIVPNVVGETEGVGSAALVAAGLTVGAVTTANDPNVPAGTILSQNPVGGTSVPPGSAVALVVSAGPADVIVPNVVGETEGVGSAALVAAGLTVGAVTTANDPNVPAGTILSQNPVGGTSVPPGSAVALVVSAGPAFVIVPSVFGLIEEEGRAVLVAAGLTVSETQPLYESGFPLGTILGQIPRAGTEVLPGSAVELHVVVGGSRVGVPGVVGLDLATAESLLSPFFQAVVVSERNDDTVPAGHVISQDPEAETLAEIGSSVELVLSLGPVLVTVPDVVGLTQAIAESAVTTAGLTVGVVSTANHPTVPVGRVISQNPPAGAGVVPGTSVALILSVGPANVTVPNVVGTTQAAAGSAITAVGLAVGVIATAHHPVVPAGIVISQNPIAGASVAPGTPVALVLSLGPAPVVVPNVVGQEQGVAEAALLAAGLAVGTVTTALDSNVPEGSVISQNPVAGASVPPGSAVNLLVSLGAVATVDITLPVVTLTALPAIVDPGQAVTIQVTATDDVGVVGRSLRVGLVGVALDATGKGIFVPAAPGLYQAVAEATDAAGNMGVGTTQFRARAASNSVPPSVSMTAPAADAIVSVPTSVVGTASDLDLAFYELQAAPAGSANFLTFVQGTTSVNSGVLGELDPRAFVPGSYQIRLCAEDTWGHRSCTTARNIEIAGATAAPGVIRFAFFDGFVQMAGLPITIRRVYDSRDKSSGDFGVGWNLDTDDIKLQANRVMGVDWRIDKLGGFFPTFRLTASAEHRVTAFLPGGEAHRFRMRPSPEQQQLIPIDFLNGATFEAFPGTTSTLTPNSQPDLVQPVLNSSGPVELYTIELQLYNPSAYTLKLKDGRQLTFGQVGNSLAYRLTQLREPNGNFINFGTAGITHSAGAGISFIRDATGRITSLTDPDGRTRTYAYNVGGDLASSTDFTGQTTEYRYDAFHNLIQVIDPRGKIPGTLIYDDQNRIVGVIDSAGNRVEVQRDEAANQEIITDRLGNTTVHTYDNLGNILSTVDALGQTSSFTYDAQGRLLTRTDPLGNVETLTYDASGNLLTHTDALGNTTVQTYDAAGNLLTQTDPLGRRFAYEYSAQGNVTAVVTPRGGRIVQAYDGAGNLTSHVTPTGEAATFSRAANGRLDGYTFPGGRPGSVTTRSDGQLQAEEFTVGGRTVRYEYDYDANGSLTGMTLPGGDTSSIRYDETGLPTDSTDSLGRTTSVKFDLNGNVTSHVDYDGTRLDLERDAENRVTSITKAGQRVDRVLDALGRPTVVRMPGGQEVSTTRDAAGRIISQTQTGEGALTHEYDAAGRVTRSTAADGGVSQYEYDVAGQLIRVTNPLGHATRFEYDLDGNLVRTLFADGTDVRVEYDLSRRLTAAIDEVGVRLSYTYDGAGDLATATDPAGGISTYTYDGMGNLARAVSSTGRTWEFAYDLRGNQLSRTQPWGGTEQYELDAGGGITRIIDGAGLVTEFAYDSANRVIRRDLEGGRTENLAYTPSGKLSTASTPNETAAYTYDAADRVGRVDFGASGAVDYTYDVAGRLASLATPAGTTTYAYDAVGRLTGVIDTQAGAASYQYDAAGQLSQALLPDGSTTVYTRDVRGRITRIVTTAPGGAVLRDETITLDAAGNPIGIQEDSRQVTYAYDAAGRIASETRTGADAGGGSFTYDGDWNLLQNGARVQSYDAGGRLASDGLFTSHTYDDAGRPLSRSNATVTEQFTYDSLGRLVRVDRTGGAPSQVLLDYNHRGLISRVDADGAVRNLLWDVTAAVPVLLEERDDAGGLLARYTYGLGPIAVSGANVRVLHHDPLGSVRLVTAADASVVERSAFAAYGERTLGAGASTRLQFTGEYFLPELGLYFLRTRFYDPTAGRFLTPDLLEPIPNQPQTYNPYLYVGANPVRFRDPLGTFSVGSISVGLAIISVMVSIALPHFPAPVLLIARALGLTQADAQVGLSVALSIGQGIWAGGLQVDILYGPTKKAAVLWIFAGGEIGSVRSDPRFGGINIIFWAGPIYGEAGADPGDPRPGVYIMFAGTLAHVLGNFAFKGGSGNSTKVQPQWSRGSGALQFEILGVNKDGSVGSSFRQAFTFYGAGWNALTGELDKIKFAAKGEV